MNSLTRPKAGMIPFIREDGVTRMMFMTPSDPRYGGDRPSIAKGNIDPNEDTRGAAIREAEEELGLIRENMQFNPMLAWEGGLVGTALDGSDLHYTVTVYVVPVKNKSDFIKPHYETGEVTWLTAEEFAEVGRATQNSAVQAIAQVIKDPIWPWPV